MAFVWRLQRDQEVGTLLPKNGADSRTGVCLLTLGFVAAAAIGGGIGSVITTVTLEPTTTTKIVAYRDPYGRKPDGTPTDTPANIYESLGRTCENGYTMGEVIVSMNLGKNGTQSDAFFALIDTLGEGENVTYRSNYTNMFSGYFTEQRLTEFHQAGVNEPANESFTGGITIESNCIVVAEAAEGEPYAFFNNVAAGTQDVRTDRGLWGLDRIDNERVRDNRFAFGSMTGEDVVVYVVDSDIRIDHQEFGGGPNDGSRAKAGFSAHCPTLPGGPRCGLDFGYKGVIGDGHLQAPPATCSSHGTMVASLIAGQTLGVAKRATVVSVAALDCSGRGERTHSIASMDWIIGNHREGDNPASIIAYSASTFNGVSLNRIANFAIGAGISVFNSAGNGAPIGTNTKCGRELNDNPNVMTVGATMFQDNWTSFSNFGPCVQISAPGQDVRGAISSSTTTSSVSQGTSYSMAYVAGIAATILGANRDLSPADIMRRIKCWASPNVITTNWLAGYTPNLFAHFDTRMATDCPN